MFIKSIVQKGRETEIRKTHKYKFMYVYCILTLMKMYDRLLKIKIDPIDQLCINYIFNSINPISYDGKVNKT